MARPRGLRRMNIRWRNGRIEELRPDEASVSPEWGAFTTVGCNQGQPLLWPHHSRRLATTLGSLGVAETPMLPTENELRRLLEAAGLNGPARVRVVARRVNRSRWNVEASAISCDAVGPKIRPARLMIQQWPSAPPLAGHKTLARLAWDLARERAQQQGYDDVLLTDSEDNLLETSVANVWVLKNGVLRTPPAPDRCLPGVMRGWLLENLHRADPVAEVGELALGDGLGAHIMPGGCYP